MLALIGVIFVILWIPIASILTGTALSTMWDWFVVPLGIAPIGVAHAIGLSLLVNFVIHTPKAADDDDDDESAWETIGKAIFLHLAKIGFVLLIGYIAKSYM